MEVLNRVDLNQLVLSFEKDGANVTAQIADLLNGDGTSFVRTTHWKGREALRISIVSKNASCRTGQHLAERILDLWAGFAKRN